MALTLKRLRRALQRWFADHGPDHRAAEERLRLLEERLELATSTGKVGVWDWDILANRVSWTSSLYAIHGIAPRDFDGTVEGLAMLVHPGDRAQVRLAIERALADGPSYETEFRALRPDGTVVWLYTNGRVAREGGKPVRMVGATVDIDARKRIELALRDSEHRLRLALRAADAGVWELNPITGESFMSDEYRALYGYDEATPVTHEEWLTRVHPDDRHLVADGIESRIASGAADFREEFRIHHPTRGVRWILSMGHIEHDERGQPTMLSGINMDITRIKLVEEELRDADQRKNEFIATLAHELRNPLAPIRNGLEILRLAESGGDPAERARTMMDRQLQQMVRLIDDLLDVSRISRGKIQLKREAFDLKTALQSALEVSEPMIDGAGHVLTVDAPDGALIVDGDLTRLAQVFSNLLNNAAKYTNPGGRIWLTVRRDADDVVVAVRDNGIGIPASMQPKIFEMFSQVDHSLQRTQGGLGIGLSIARRLVQMHGGALDVRSEGLGAGSEFRVRLPLRMSAVASAERKRAHSTAPTFAYPLRVLVADDNLDAAASLATMLEMKGHEVRTARDGEEALRIAQAFRPDVALLDIGMPKLNGYEACARLRERRDARDMLIIALTGWGQSEDKRRPEEAGFDRHLVKPADVHALDLLLDQAQVRRSRAQQR